MSSERVLAEAAFAWVGDRAIAEASASVMAAHLEAAGYVIVPKDADPCEHCVMEHVWPCPTIPRCDEPGCERETSCGFPTPNGYRRTCGEHYRAALSDGGES